jgi:hypothetical protein
MPRLATSIYAAHQASVLKMAAKEGGISRGEIADALNVSKSIATNIIKKCGLELDHKDGRTEYFKPSDGDASDDTSDAPETELPPAVKSAAVAGPEIIAEDDDDIIAELDAEIVDTRNTLKDVAARCGKHLGAWAADQSLVDVLRKRLADLVDRRMNACG